jgi:FKBP-type peptidyl-prolyl cis-trans isomerase FkpA
MAPQGRGRKFDSSMDRDDPFDLPLGDGNVIAGWSEGVQGMEVGGTRVLTIRPQVGYGAHGAGGVIPPNVRLVFEVELLGGLKPPNVRISRRAAWTISLKR